MAAHGKISGHGAAWDGLKWLYDDNGEPVGDGERACRHCGKPPVPVAVIVPADLSHTGEARLAIKPIDACIADLIRRLNAGATEPVTAACCCGHGEAPGEIILCDGRKLTIERRETEP